MKISYRYFISAFAALSGLAASDSNAALVQYNFSATIYHLFEYNASKDTSIDLLSSSFAGSLVSNGDKVVGSVYFDNAASLSPYYQPPTPTEGTYQLYTSFGSTQQTRFNVGTVGPSYASSVEQSAYTLIQVANNASTFSGWDILSLSNSAAYNAVMSQDMTINLFDKTGTAFQNSSIPANIDLARFFYANLDSGWLRRSDGNQFHFEATLTSLIAAPVPELRSNLLLIVGFAIVFGFSRYRIKFAKSIYTEA
jgi:hypothetical protein